MMEFTLSRCVMMICGAILMAAVVSPIGGMFDHEESETLQELADKDAEIIDAFLGSGIDSITVDGSTLLPSVHYEMTIDGNRITVSDGDKEYTSFINGKAEKLSVGYYGSLVFSHGTIRSI